MPSIPYVGYPCNFHGNGNSPPIEDAHVSNVEANGTTCDLTIDSDGRPESDVPIKLKSGPAQPRYWTI